MVFSSCIPIIGIVKRPKPNTITQPPQTPTRTRFSQVAATFAIILHTALHNFAAPSRNERAILTPGEMVTGKKVKRSHGLPQKFTLHIQLQISSTGDLQTKSKANRRWEKMRPCDSRSDSEVSDLRIQPS